MHTKTTHPFITLWKLDSSLDYPEVRQGSLTRDFLDNTYKGHGYHCPPMTTSNISGWEFLLPQDVTVIWDGVRDPSPDHIKILSGEFYNGVKLVETVTGDGTIRFLSNVIVETDEDHFSIITGSPNYFFDGAEPYSVIFRTDHHSFGQTFFGWRITKPNIEITFPKGMPFMFLRNYPKSLMESTIIEFKDLNNDLSKKEKVEKYSEMLYNFSESSNDWEWSGHYKKGISPEYPDGKDIGIKPKLNVP